MLQAIRDQAQGWIAWIIVILISIPFALWGIHEYFGADSEIVVAKVEGEEITERDVTIGVQNLRFNLRQALGSSYNPEQHSDEELRRQVLDELIQQRLLRATTDDWGLRVGDQWLRQFIQQMPEFQQEGRFDVQRYRALLARIGRSEQAFEQSTRDQITQSQLLRAINDSAFVTKNELAEQARLSYQTRTLRYFAIPLQSYYDQIELTDAEITAHYDDNPELYRQAERAKVDYVVLDLTDVAMSLRPSEETLRSYFSDHQEEFRTPEERQVRHILFRAEQNADQTALEAAKAKAMSVQKQLEAGADFAALAKELSEDPGSAKRGGELGWIRTGQLVKPFEDMVYTLNENAISEPVRTQFGYHILQVTGIRGGEAADFDAAKARVSATYRQEEAERQFHDAVERLDELVYADSNSLQPAAAELGLEVKTSDWIDRGQGSGDFANDRVQNAIFDPEVLEQGLNSPLLELEQDRYLALRLNQHQPETAKPLASVKGMIREKLMNEKAAQLAQAAARKAQKELAAGAVVFSSLAENSAWTLKTKEPVTVMRESFDQPLLLIESVFEMPKPAEGAASYAVTEIDSGDYALIELTGVTDGDLAHVSDVQRQVLEDRLAVTLGRGDFDHLVKALENKADVSIFTAESDETAN